MRKGNKTEAERGPPWPIRSYVHTDCGIHLLYTVGVSAAVINPSPSCGLADQERDQGDFRSGRCPEHIVNYRPGN